MKRIVIITGTILIVILGIWFFLHHNSQNADQAVHGGRGGKNSAAIPVGVATAKTGSVDVYLNGLGNVTPRSTITVHTQIDGQLMRVDFQEGQLVKTDDLLAEIDARPYQAQLEQAEGQLIRDEALLSEARIDLQRYTTLFAQDSIAKQQLDLQASLVKQYEGDVKNDQGLIDAAKTDIMYSQIRSPVNGRVGLRQVDPGNLVQTTDANGIVVVTELQPITSIFVIPEDNIPEVMKHVQTGEKLVAEAWDRDNKNKLATGLLTAIDNEVDPNTGTVKFRAEFANKDNALFPSQFINIKLRLETKENVILIPTAAVQRGTQGTFVYLVKGEDKDKTVSVQPITLGTAEGEVVSVDKGLAAGDVVVIDGTDNLRDGAKIEVASPAAKEAPTADTTGTAANEAENKTHHKHKKHSDNADNTSN